MKTKGFNFNGFKLILQSTQEDLVEYFTEELPKIYGKDNCKLTNDYLFCKGKNKVLLVAHMDTVHTDVPELILFDSQQGIIWSPQGIGGDDRGGIYSIIYIINYCVKNNKDLPYILFTTSEEIGCVGAKKAADELEDEVKDIMFAIELDRKGSEDMVFYGCKNDDFEKFIEEFGFKKATGSCSDISKICPEWGFAGVNLSHGVYNCHTKNELIYVDEMFDTINKVIKILESDSKKKFEYSDGKYSKSSKYSNISLDRYNKSKSYINSYDVDDNEEEEEEKESAKFLENYGKYYSSCYDDYYYNDVPMIGKEEDDSLVEDKYKNHPKWKKYKDAYGVKWAKCLIDDPDYSEMA